jgi:hypothetical protein
MYYLRGIIYKRFQNICQCRVIRTGVSAKVQSFRPFNPDTVIIFSEKMHFDFDLCQLMPRARATAVFLSATMLTLILFVRDNPLAMFPCFDYILNVCQKSSFLLLDQETRITSGNRGSKQGYPILVPMI